ncbi:hypothetical protein LTR37_019073 [Vermiconidia calcicola]|uniref:Uncharacterized protein n=1 Tax=Vermiconidia calcicola TaxID=1690605 RepID=A0ACC3MF57_9PEZI|nr:hypothetical protein LTR37_019073 [Vermiconidia calcicola]
MDYVPLPKSRLWNGKADFFRPFRTAAAEAGENITPLYDPALHRAEQPEDIDLEELNAALAALIDVFPDVHPEVFRKMLLSISKESRLEVVTEHLLTKQAKWVRGRYRSPQSPSNGKLERPKLELGEGDVETAVPEGVMLRSDSYKMAVKQVCYQEYRSLSHSSIKAVLAEENFSYTLARPILQQLSSRPWRFSLSSLWPKRTLSSTAGEHPYVIWQSPGSVDGLASPAVKRTGSPELDQELYDLFVAPVLDNQRQTLLAGDHAFATRLNDAEAEAADALFECECCYGSVTFEQTSTCDDGCHQLCFECVRRTVNEALFGQGWSRTVDLERSTLRCFAPTANECSGIVPSSIIRLALSRGAEKEDIWDEFHERAASEALAKSRLPFQRCPFCSYVEVDEIPPAQRRKAMAIWQSLTTKSSTAFQLLVLAVLASLLVFTVPLLLLASFVYLFIFVVPPASAVLQASWARVYKQHRGLKFTCRSPKCRKMSCVRCLARWKDPHVCFENEKTSLRTAIESSATAAIKRTCPKCLLSFVKSSGCNKLVCNCGYTMCYICRQEITSREGYTHFCQHFRPTGGRCVECERCDLYGDEDEEAAIRRAAETAERVWKEKEGEKEDDRGAAKAMVEALVGEARDKKYWETWLDAIVGAVVA